MDFSTGAVAMEEICHAGQRAMQIGLVLDKITKHLPHSDLLTLRQTCKTWNHFCVPELRPGSGIWLTDPTQLAIFTRQMRSSLSIPFGNYGISNFASTFADRSLVEDLFSVCGPTIDTMSLGNLVLTNPLDWPDLEQLRRVIFEGCQGARRLTINLWIKIVTKPIESNRLQMFSKEIPNLQTLDLDIGHGAAVVDGQGRLCPLISSLLADILREATGLESISLLGEKRQLHHPEKLLSVIRECLVHPEKLKSLRLHSVCAAGLRILTEYGFGGRLRLHKFASAIVMGCRRHEDAAMAEVNVFLLGFLQSQSETLLDLELAGIHTDARSIFALPALPILRSFSYFCGNSALSALRFEEGSMAATFPQLDNFRYQHETKCECGRTPPHDPFVEFPRPSNHVNWVDPGTHFQGGVSHLKMKIIDSDCGNAANLGLFQSAFPSVTRLAVTRSYRSPVHCPVHEFAHLATLWPALTSLSIKFSPDSELDGVLQLDEVLTGIPEERHEELRAQLSPSMDFTQLRHLMDKYKTQPAVSDLVHLQKLTLCTYGYVVTDTSGYLCFGMLSKLQQLCVGVCNQDDLCLPCCSISAECKSFLRKQLGLPAVIML